jgi:hypothetical protein
MQVEFQAFDFKLQPKNALDVLGLLESFNDKKDCQLLQF